ncbi:NAD(P)-binding domain-containing protein, partial [Bosea sp. (in: a-proteobacteria)]|uniref:NAD(P)-binding domain-containing protein n=1 Tax=Bosea sp. (in: a-proteobacteria) TaxID=1871050 RepID=UPI002FC6725D
MTTIGFVGLGSMGLPMAINLGKAGFAVTGFDLRAEARGALEAAGGRAAGSLTEAFSGRDAAVLMVVNAAQAEDILFGRAALA